MCKIEDVIEFLNMIPGSDETSSAINYLKKLQYIEHLQECGRIIVLPEVNPHDWKNFVDGLDDYFKESMVEDTSCGVFSMTDGEQALAKSMMDVFNNIGYNGYERNDIK